MMCPPDRPLSFSLQGRFVPGTQFSRQLGSQTFRVWGRHVLEGVYTQEYVKPIGSEVWLEVLKGDTVEPKFTKLT